MLSGSTSVRRRPRHRPRLVREAREPTVGRFVGQGIAKDRDNKVFDRSLRELDTIVEPAGEGGFTVKWTTVIRDGETGKKIDNTMTFAPAGKLNVFKAVDAGDPIAKGHYAWARIDGRTLTINVLEVGDEGAGRWQVR